MTEYYIRHAYSNQKVIVANDIVAAVEKYKKLYAPDWTYYVFVTKKHEDGRFYPEYYFKKEEAK